MRINSDEVSEGRIGRGVFLGSAASLLFIAACSSVPQSAAATQPGIGEWQLTRYRGRLLLKLTVFHKDGHDSNQFPVNSSLSAGDYSTRPLRFSVTRDAGTFECEGSVSKGVGGGVITAFDVNPNFERSIQPYVHSPTRRDLEKLALFDIDSKTLAAAFRRQPHTTIDQVLRDATVQRFNSQPAWLRSG